MATTAEPTPDASANQNDTSADPQDGQSTAVAATQTGGAADSTVSTLHQIKVGEPLIENVEGHAARTDSPEFKLARATLRKIMALLTRDPYGTGPPQAHHGGSIWVHGGGAPDDWHLVLNWAGIEWSAQFCCDPAKVEQLRQNAFAVTNGFPATMPALTELGYTDTDILTTPIVDAATIGRYVDSIWNSCVPIPEAPHIGHVTQAAPLGAGVHNYPEPMCAIPRVMRDDFVPFVTDPATQTVAAVAPVAPRGSGDGRVRVLFAEKGNPLHDAQAAAHASGSAVVLSADHPVAQAAFAEQNQPTA
jgi:hypothetical protein